MKHLNIITIPMYCILVSIGILLITTNQSIWGYFILSLGSICLLSTIFSGGSLIPKVLVSAITLFAMCSLLNIL